MSQTCDGCSKVVYRRKFMPTRGIWLGVDCGCVAADAIPKGCRNAFDLTLDHVHDEFGVVAAVSINHMPDQHVGGAAPVEHVENRSVRSLLQQLIAAVLLRHFKSFVRIYF